MFRFLIFSTLLTFLTACQSVSTSKSLLKHDTALVVGTIHKFHIDDKSYPLEKLEQIIMEFKPDLVLVEIRPVPFSKSLYEDGPFEMTYITEISKKHGIQVAPIDYWTEADLEKQLNSKEDPKKEKEFEAEFSKIKKPEMAGSTFEQIHSAEKLREHARILNLRERVYDGNGDWNSRQAWFHHNADDAIEKFKAHRVLAFVGYEHKTQLQAFLDQMGFMSENPLSYATDADFKTYCIPIVVLSDWNAGSKRLSDEAKKLAPKIQERIQSKADYFAKAAEFYRQKQCQD